MPSASYSFLDVVILDEVRQRFAAGDAMVILSTDLEQVIWANGPGAALFGYPDVEAVIGASAQLGLAAKRQISATSGFPAIGRDRSVMVRLATGMTSRAVTFLATALAMPDGEKAILLAVPAAVGGARSEREIAARAIGGFSEAGHFVAFVDAQGGIEAASPGFSALGLSGGTLAGMVEQVGGDRIVKRMITAAKGQLPAGLARLNDEPARHLLVVIDEARGGEDVSEPVDAAAREPEAAAVGGDAQVDGVASEQVIEGPLAIEEPDSTAKQADAGQPEAAQAAPAGQKQAETGHDTWYFTSDDHVSSDEPRSEALVDKDAPEPAELPEPEAATHDDGEPGAGIVEPETETDTTPRAPEAPALKTAIAPNADQDVAPVRFIWRTDAEGKFSQISPEFAGAVGKAAADIIGRQFKDVAREFGLDEDGEIAGLLDRRDTWSGRSVLWPIAGTELKAPVDLAALPVYSRDRKFEGFRGFGVARMGDAIVDANGPGLVLAGASDAAEPDPSSAPTPTQAEPADPFQGEVPALNIVPMPDRRSADKIIRLAEHRQPANDKGLSAGERIAFQQIAERLKRDGVAPASDATATEKPTEAKDAGAIAPTGEDSETALPQAVDTAAEPVGSDATVAAPSEELGATGDLAEMPDEPKDIADLAALDGVEDAAAADVTGEAADAAKADMTVPLDTRPDMPGAAQEAAPARKPARRGMSLLDFEQPKPDEGDTVAEPEKPIAADDSLPLDGTAADTSKAEALAEPATQTPPLKTKDFTPSAYSPGSEAPRQRGADTAVLEKLPVPVLVHSGDELHYANGEFLALTGYQTIEQLAEAGGIGALFADNLDDKDEPGRRDRQLRLINREGEEFPVEAFLQSVPWNGGKALLLVLRRADEGAFGASASQSPLIAELEARVAEMRTIIDTATDGVVLIAGDGRIRSISRPAEALFGFDSDEVAGKAFESLFAIESQRAARDYLNGLSDNGVASVLNDGREVIGRESQGRFIPLFMTIGQLPNDSGYCAVVRDITQWKRAEEDLTQARAVAERASSQKTDFLARVSHEIRTPLNAIIGFSELMVDEKFGPVANDRYRDYLRDINRSGNHVLDLVNDLLDISKIEAGQQEMDYEAVSLNDTLVETVAMMQPQANRERVIIRSSFASKLPDVVADLRSVRQIALNILSNAIRYTQAGGQVIVSTAYEGSGEIVMRVRDTGIGMTQPEIEQALKPFKQINSLKRARGDGTGLGLPLTKAMVEANRAKFTINSTPGEGTLVEITFPSTRVLAD